MPTFTVLAKVEFRVEAVSLVEAIKTVEALPNGPAVHKWTPDGFYEAHIEKLEVNGVSRHVKYP